MKLVYNETDGNVPLNQWIQERQRASDMFYFWNLIMRFQKLILIFLRSLRTHNFILYINSLVHLIKYAFILDRKCYSRWLSVHIKDLLEIPGSHENVYEEFIKGNFVVQKMNRKFSDMGLDQAHEQNNNVIKHTSKGIQTDLTSLKTFVGPLCIILMRKYALLAS